MNITIGAAVDRDSMARIAGEEAQRIAQRHRHLGARVVVVFTDAAGNFVGVGGSSADEDRDAILRCATEAVGKRPASE